MFLFVFFLSNAHGIPQYYTFEGSITDISRDDLLILEDAGTTIGQQIIYTFLVDTDREGYRIYSSGFLESENDFDYEDEFSFPDYYYDERRRAFYTEYSGVTALEWDSGIAGTQHHYGIERLYLVNDSITGEDVYRPAT